MKDGRILLATAAAVAAVALAFWLGSSEVTGAPDGANPRQSVRATDAASASAWDAAQRSAAPTRSEIQLPTGAESDPPPGTPARSVKSARPDPELEAFVRPKYDRIKKAATRRNTSLPEWSTLSDEQQSRVAVVQVRFEHQIQSSFGRVAEALDNVAQEKVAAGQAEPFRQERAKPEFEGQRIVSIAGPAGSFIVRVNPGESHDVDAAVQAEDAAWAMYLEALTAATR